MLRYVLLVLSVVSFVASPSFADELHSSKLTYNAGKPSYGAIVTIEHGVRVHRMVPSPQEVSAPVENITAPVDFNYAGQPQTEPQYSTLGTPFYYLNQDNFRRDRRRHAFERRHKVKHVQHASPHHH